MSNKLSQFWQELKRRNVVRVITVYAGAAFVILELVDIIAEPLKLPSWLLPVVIVLLSIGFIIAVILSWIYDVHPEGGIVKTESVNKITEQEKPKSSSGWKMASYISFAVIVGLIALNIFGGRESVRIDKSLAKSIAVLPFHNYIGDPGQDHMCEGLTDEIIDNLFKVKSFDEIRSLTSVLPYKDSDKSATEIAEALRVNYILEGSYKRVGDSLRITAQLIEPKSDNHIWLHDYDMPYDQVIGIPTEIALQIAAHLKVFITEDEQQRIEKTPTDNLDAYEYYMLGKRQLYRQERDEERWRAVEYFQQAVAIDASFALAYSGLAEAYYQMINFSILSPKDAFPKAKASALKALSLNDGLAISHCTLALIKQSSEYDFKGAEQEYKRALEIDPRSFEAHFYYSGLLLMIGRYDEAISHCTMATNLDPFSTMAETNRILIHYYAGYKNEAVKAIEMFRDTYPENPYGYWFSAVFYSDLGRYEEALQMLKTQITLMGEDNISDEVGLQGYLYGKMGQRDKAVEQLDQLNILSSEGYYIDPRTRVWVYLGINELDTAIEILKKSFNDHLIDPLYMKIFPSEYIQHDPEFIELQKNVGLID